MNEQSFFIEGTLPGMNDILLAKSSRWRGKYNNMKKKAAEQIGASVRESNIQHVDHAVFDFLWIEQNHRRDPDNVVAGGRKFILDTLVLCGVLDDDSAKYVFGWRDSFGYDKASPGVQVTIREI